MIEIERPVLGVRCKDCGNAYLGYAIILADKEQYEAIGESVDNGDTVFITTAEEFELEFCECEEKTNEQ